MPFVDVNLGPRSYRIAVNEAALTPGQFAKSASPRSKKAILVVDAQVQTHAESIAQSLISEQFSVHRIVVPSGESAKSQEQLNRLYDFFLSVHADRSTLIVAIGGGVTGDLAGFAAATFHRGLPLLMIPTTLLAMVDSSVGGKTAINLPQGKNLIGAFHQPSGVWIDFEMLTTLPDREYRAGLAEVVKYGAALDADFFAFQENHQQEILQRTREILEPLVVRSCRLKADIVEQDERERTGLRAVLNYGHTFGHAFEHAGKYSDWLHGEAVAAGMICASRLSESLGLIPPETTHRQKTLLESFGLPTAPRPDWPVDDLWRVMLGDKKNEGGELRLVILESLGKAVLRGNIPAYKILDSLNPS